MALTKLTDADFDKVVNNCMKQVNLKKVAWSIPQIQIDLVTPLLGIWNTRYAVTQNKKLANSADREAKVQARNKLSPVFGDFIEVNIYRNRKMDDAAIISCNLELRSKTLTRAGKPKTTPQLEYKRVQAHGLLAYYKQAQGEDGTSKRGKPKGVGRIEINCKLLDLKPNSETKTNDDLLHANPDDFTKHISGTVSPVEISFLPGDAGKTVLLAARWISTNNISGDWGKVEWMMIM